MINFLPGAPKVYSKLKTYIPFRNEEKLGEGQGNIMGVIEVVNDLSGDMGAIIQLQGRIILLSLIIMGILFGVLSFIVFRADRIIEARAVERRQLEVKLSEVEHLASLGKMVAAVSHEIKNPLGIIRSTAEVLGKRITKVAPGNDHLASIIVEETSRLDKIVREFLDFARPADLKLELVSLNTLVKRAARFMQPEFDAKSIKLVKELDQQLPGIPLDSEQIYQVLLNIMINAIQAMPEGGTLTIRSGVTLRGKIELDVSDDGIGMSPEKLEQIYSPFFTDKNRGSGLGLAIA